MRGANRHFSGLVLLAMESENYRLEVVSKTGNVLIAIAGTPDRAVRIDPSSGAKTVLPGGMISLSEDFVWPAIFLRSMVTGAAPEFGGIKSTSTNGALRMIKVKKPDMDISYSDKLELITFYSEEGDKISLSLGEMRNGSIAPYVSSAVVDYNNLEITIQWSNVHQGLNFPDGFFEFNESTSGSCN